MQHEVLRGHGQCPFGIRSERENASASRDGYEWDISPLAREYSSHSPSLPKKLESFEMDKTRTQSRSLTRPRRFLYRPVVEDSSDIPQSFTDYDSIEDDASDEDLPGEDQLLDAISQISKASNTRPLDEMPFEILDMIFSALDQSSLNDLAPCNTDLLSCLLTSKKMHAAALPVLWQNISIPHSITFSKVLRGISRECVTTAKSFETDLELGRLVRRLDFSRYTSFGFGRSRQAASEINCVTPNTLRQCLSLMPGLREFLVHELIDEELDTSVLDILFSGTLRALDFCASSSQPFVAAFSTAASLTQPLPFLERLSLHECLTLQAPVFEELLPKLPNLTHLDVAHTLISAKALLSIPSTARLTHLNLARCNRITGRAVVEFLTTHEAAKSSLVYLNLKADNTSYTLLYEKDVEALLPSLPPTLRSVNLGGAVIKSSHQNLLMPLAKSVEELGLANADLSMEDIKAFFPPNAALSDGHFSGHPLEWMPSSLRYLDLTGVESITPASLFNSSSMLLSEYGYPLEVIELHEGLINHLKARESANDSVGWAVRELGRRGWFVRKPLSDKPLDDGSRAWKMGARWWGMRKVPVAVQEVGGMYGHYMFKA